MFRILLILVVALPSLLYCGTTSSLQDSPPAMLWAWERNEDLRFINSDAIGVAYLAQTLSLTRDKVILIPRRQPLKINSGTFLIAVTRIETYRPNFAFSKSQLNETAKLIVKSSLHKDVKGIQIDFDVKVSEREFYKKLLVRVRENLVKDKTLSITALASFCVGDRWMEGLPIDEAVPMLFEMGADSWQITRRLKSGKDFAVPLCKMSYGLAIYEPHNIKFKQKRTIYYFNSNPWKPADLEKLK